MDPFEEFRSAMEGKTCLGLVQQSYYYKGVLNEPVNAMYLKFDEGRFAKFGIDAVGFYWREVNYVEIITAAGPDHAYPLTDLAEQLCLQHQTIEQVAWETLPDGSNRLTIHFENGGRLFLVHGDWKTTLEYLPAHVS